MMKKIYLILTLTFFFISHATLAQTGHKLNLKDGFMAEGYDVVSYFNKKAKKGLSKFNYEYQGAKYKFSSKKNLNTFKNNPSKYSPQYGGWCAYAMATKSEYMGINPKSFDIRNGKLYLFYNSFFSNTLEDWLERNPDKLVKKADTNWKALRQE